MSTEKCDKDVYENGEVFGVFAWSKQEAEEFCMAQTKETGDKYDWHFVGGRVVVKYLSQAPANIQQQVPADQGGRT